MCLLRGLSFSQWLRDHGFNPTSSFNALQGRRDGPQARRVRDAVHAEFGSAFSVAEGSGRCKGKVRERKEGGRET